ncbi:MAG: PspC domain-containing protein [Acidobacteria bacterium]|nr:PspC domain-containing protein [Acidobacteriota bacterium]
MTDTPAPEAPPRRLTRSLDDRMLGGVCGGLADYTGIDPVVFRIGFSVAALLGGGGVLAYLLAWALIPEEGDPERERPNTALVIALVVVAVIFGFPLLIVSVIFGRGIPIVGLIILVLILSSPRRRARWRHAAPWSASPPPDPSTPPTQPEQLEAALQMDRRWREHKAEMRQHHRRERERSRLWLLTVSAGLVVSGILAALDASNAAELSAATVFSMLLLVVAAGLIVGAWYGHARRLILLGFLLSIGAVSTTAADVHFGGGFGDRRWQPTSVGELRHRYHLGGGHARLDLRLLKGVHGTRVTKVDVGMGNLEVTLPSDVDVEVRASTGIGRVEIPDRGLTRRFDHDEHVFFNAPGTNRLVLDLHVGVGHLLVQGGGGALSPPPAPNAFVPSEVQR